MEEKRQAGEMARGGRDQKSDHRVSQKPSDQPTLASQGIDKNLADRARAEARKSDETFETEIAKAREVATAVAEGNKAVISAARAELHKQKKESRARKEEDLADKITALPEAKFGVVANPWPCAGVCFSGRV